METKSSSSYLERIVDYFYALPYEDIDDKTLYQIHRSFLDYCGCAFYTGYNRCCQEIESFLLNRSASGTHPVWGSGRGTTAPTAACIHGCRVSNIEMDDGSGINAAVHPGLYVWTGALTAYETHPCDEKTFTKAVLFGYDLLMRLGMLGAKSVSRLELHGPGLSGALGTAAAAGMVMGLNREEMLRALGIAGSLLPLCPFISFVQGVTVKDFYGGWGCYLGMLAVEMAKEGMTGSAQIMDGDKSLKEFYFDDWGKNTPLGELYYINVIGFKEYPACLALHPMLIALETLQKQEPLDYRQIRRVKLRVSPSAMALSGGVTFPLSPTSARIYLPYAAAAALVEGRAHPDSFLPGSLERKDYASLMERIEVEAEEEFGRQSIRACRAEIELENGRILRAEAKGIRWCDGPVEDEALIRKFCMLTEGIFSQKEQEQWQNLILNGGLLSGAAAVLAELGRAHEGNRHH